MLFSVVIPTYNRAHLLQRTLESVFAQVFNDFEVIVVDDGSTDDTETVVRVWGDKIQFLRTEHSGPGAARNFGVGQAKGEYVAFLDSDDLWFPWTTKNFARLIDEYHRPALLVAKFIEFQDEVELDLVREEPIQAKCYKDYFASATEPYNLGAGMIVIRRDLFLRVGGFIDRRINGEDHDLAIRLGIESAFVAIKTPYTLAYRRHASSETSNSILHYDGNMYLLTQEYQGAYPGGTLRANERHEIITRHIRPVSLSCISQGAVDKAWLLYKFTFKWHLQQNRWRYLLAIPILAIASHFKTSLGNGNTNENF